ncbi:MAG: PLDc N-terminal domain-containing protein [Anaerolineae bacterium]|nr:PLDc N-terminal domain-containing protein [Anaerolineae bacterium]
MEGTNTIFLLAQILNIVLLIAWITLAVWALLRLRREKLQDMAQVIWVAIILLIPILGALAFLIVRSRSRKLS